MTAQECQHCLTAITIAVHSEQTLMKWSQRLSVEERREVLARLIRQGDQRAVELWENACQLADEQQP